MPESVVIAGSLAQRPGYGGHTWVFLQYLLGFRRLGWDVLFLDWLDPAMSVDATGRTCAIHESWNFAYLRDVMRRFGLEDDFALLDAGSQDVLGMTRARLMDRVKKCAFILNIMGYVRDEEILALVWKRVFLDIDPGFGQMWRELGLHDLYRDHDTWVTVGTNVGRPECLIPTCGLNWITTLPPVVLECWPTSASSGDAFTSIASWRGPFAPIEYQGTVYGLRVHEFRRFAGLPRRTGGRFELALDIHPADTADLKRLHEGGWILIDPRVVSGDPDAYRAFIRSSFAEFQVAKGMYVQTKSGWISDRSVCYLASGKPVLAQDTGACGHLPVGEGLLLFSTLEDAAAGVEEIASHPERHAGAARALAEAFFDSDRVLGRLVDRLGGM